MQNWKVIARSGVVTRPANEFEGVFHVNGISETLDQAAKLMEAAPDLLEALDDLVAQLQNAGVAADFKLDKAHDAYHKARAGK